MEKQKGLNVPKQIRNTPLDNCFQELSSFLSVDESLNEDIITQLNNKLPDPSKSEKTLPKLQKLMPVLFKYIHDIQELSIQKSLVQSKSKKSQEEQFLISISLHDMKTFNELLNLIIIQFIYTLLPIGIGIPIEQRRLKSFSNTSKLYQFKKLKNNHTNDNFKVLSSIIDEFQVIFGKNGDVKDLLIKGSGLTDILTVLIALIHDYDPNLKSKLECFEDSSDTYNLFGIYTVLIQNTTVPKYKKFITERLSNLTLNRSNGVISLIDFIVGIREEEEINIEKFNHVNTVLMTKPSDIPSVEYFTKIFDQLYDILIFINRPVLNSVAVNFIRVLYERNKRIVQDFLFKRIWNTLNPNLDNFEAGDVVVGEKQLNDTINVLISLTKETSEDFLNQLFAPIILKLWGFYMHLTGKNLDYSSILSNILVSFFTITSNNEILENIILNLIQINGEDWKFQTTLENNLTSIIKTNKIDNGNITNEDIFDDIDLGLKNIVALFKNLTDDVVRFQFLKVLNRWILQNDRLSLAEESINPFIMLIDLRFLEKINESFKEILMDKPDDILLVIKNLLKTKFQDEEEPIIEEEEEEEDADSDDEEDQQSNNLTIILELLSAIISETDPIELSKHKETLKEISSILKSITSNKHCQSLHLRIEDFVSNKSEEISKEDDERRKDKELFEKAIININDPLIPIRAHGLYLLRQLIIKKSDVLSLDMVLELHVLQLHDSEPFIFLNVIKSLNELIEFEQHGTIEFLLKFYTDKKDQNIDDRLKIGEVILNYIIKSNEMFNGPLVEQIISKTLGIIRDFEEDNRLRMSAMSLIGQGLRTNATGIENFIKDSLDCSIGILELEKDNVMKRSAVVLISDLLSFGGLDIVPRGYGESLKRLMEYTKLKAEDYLLVEQINKVLEIIEDLIKEKFTSAQPLPSQFEGLRIVK